MTDQQAYFAEFVTVLLMLLASLRLIQALFARHISALMLHVFASGFYGAVAMVGVRTLNFGL